MNSWKTQAFTFRRLFSWNRLSLSGFLNSTTNRTCYFQFVSHPYSQLVLKSEALRHVPFLENSPGKRFTVVLLSSLLSPLVFAIWLAFETFLPRHKVARMFHSPCLKFLTNCGAYQIFLFVLTLTSFQRDTQFLEYSITGEYRRILKVSILYFLFQLDFLEDLAYFLNVMIKQARNKII